MRRLQERGAVPPLSGDASRRAGFRRRVVLAALAGAVVALDQLTKSLAQTHLADGPVHVLGPLDLELSYNTGVAFGVGRGLGPLLVLVAVALVAVVFGMGRSARSWAGLVAAGLVLGGAVSNLGDRLFRGNGGAVIDFIRLPHWPTFNLADSAIVIGVVILVLATLRGREG